MQSFSDFFRIFQLRRTFQQEIVPKLLEIEQDKLRIFSA